MMLTAQRNGRSFSFEVGFMIGSKDAKHEGILSLPELTALSLISYHLSKRILNLDIVQFCQGYHRGYQAYLDGIV